MKREVLRIGNIYRREDDVLGMVTEVARYGHEQVRGVNLLWRDGRYDKAFLADSVYEHYPFEGRMTLLRSKRTRAKTGVEWVWDGPAGLRIHILADNEDARRALLLLAAAWEARYART